MKILSTNHVGKNRNEALEIKIHKRDIKCRRGYVKRLVSENSTKIQSQNFGGNNNL